MARARSALVVLLFMAPGCAREVTEPIPGSHATMPPATASALDTSRAFAAKVPIDGRSLWATCTDPVDGAPTIVLEHGGGADHNVWSAIVPELSEEHRVCSYDRAGNGLSDDVGPHTAQDLADDLHALVSAARIETPILLVGHSLPGLVMRVYADRYPEDLAGMVFLDPLVPYIEELQLAALPEAREGEPPALADFRALLAGLIDENDVPLAEFDNFLFNESYAQADAVTSFGDLPVIVVTATGTAWIGGSSDDTAIRDVDDRLLTALRQQHERLAALSSVGEHRTVSSVHDIPRERPDFVIDLILEIASRLRTG